MRNSPTLSAALWTRYLHAKWLRVAADLLMCGGFVAFLGLMLTGSGPSGLSLSRNNVELSLTSGAQRQGLYRGTQRLATLRWQVMPQSPGWSVEYRVWIEGTAAKTESNDPPAVRIIMGLRQDLSLRRLELDVDMARLSQLSGMSQFVLPGVGKLGDLRIHLSGRCAFETGDCDLSGTVGRNRFQRTISAGRGPVLTRTIYPLLAQGSLGGAAELRLFDPLTLSQRVVAFTVEGRQRLTLRSGETVEAFCVRRDLEGLLTRVWIDEQGRVLREELPLGLTVDHEAWERPRRRE